MNRRRLSILLGLALSVVLLWWALRDVSPAELWHQVRRADPWFLAGAVAVATGTFLLRAFRWRVLLEAAVQRTTLRNRFGAVCIGFMTNNLLPLRLGEFARAYSLSRVEPLGMSAAFASLVVERLFDGLLLLLLMIPALLSPSFAAGVGSGVVRQALLIGGCAVAVGLIAFAAMVRFPERPVGFLRRHLPRALPETTAQRITSSLTSFVAGLGALRHPGIFIRVFAWSAAVWLWNGLSFWLGFLAFDIQEAGILGALLLQSVVGFAVSIPSSPGFFGPFEAATRLALGAYGVPPVRIVSFAAGYHILTFIPVTLLGLWFAHRLGITWSEVEHSEEYVEAAVERAGESTADAPPIAERRR